jgi:hypothetical protein
MTAVLSSSVPRYRLVILVQDRQNRLSRPFESAWSAAALLWQNAYVQRLIGTLRRECLDHMLIYGERHLRRILTLYSLYYNETRAHLALRKDAPLRRAVQGSGTIIATQFCSDCIVATRGYDFREDSQAGTLRDRQSVAHE